jgi:predicted acyltransferase
MGEESTAPAAPATSQRLVSLDQFRGYTVVGMCLVNYLAGFSLTPAVLKHHHDYCSYADTIMPQFLFAVGFAFRLTFGRREKTEGLRAAQRRVVRRLAGLVALSLVIYTLGGAFTVLATYERDGPGAAFLDLCKRQWFQTLLHIAVTSLWILPVIRSGIFVRTLFMLLSAGAHVVLSHAFNFTWVNTSPHGIDGGPLGFLTWTIPAIVGTIACDALTAANRPRTVLLLAGALGLMLLGYALSCGTRFYDVALDQQGPSVPKLAESPVLVTIGDLHGRSLLAEPPLVPPPPARERQWNYWMMSQRSGTLSYLTFAAGVALTVYLLFHFGCDRLGWRVGIFRTLGTNALAAYILHGMMEVIVRPRISPEAPWWQVAEGFLLCFGCTYAVVRVMEKMDVHLRL